MNLQKKHTHSLVTKPSAPPINLTIDDIECGAQNEYSYELDS